MINDLKKFGSQAVRNCKPEHLKQGYGEVICHLIDELLNIELYRREYQFFQPVHQQDEQEDDGLDDAEGEAQDDPALHGTQELHGIKIQTEGDKNKLTSGGILSPNTVRKRGITSMGQIEETKINFFDPSKYEEQEAMFEKPAEDQIIEAKCDPLEWKQEIDRVYTDLINIEKDMELIKTGQAGGGSLLDEDIEECRRHTELIIELCHDIKKSCHSDVRSVFARVGETLQDDLSTVRRHESRINTMNDKEILKLNEITQHKKVLAVQLRQIIDSVKKLDYDNKQVHNTLIAIQNSYDEKVKDLTGTGQVNRLKHAISKLKVSLSPLSVTHTLCFV